MRREVRRVALGMAMLLSVSGLLEASPSPKPKAAPVAVADPISAALCGQGKGYPAELAKALDKLNPNDPPPIWRAEGVETLRSWLKAPSCPETSEAEAAQYSSRRRALEQLGRQLERAKVTERIGTVLAPFRDWRLSSEEWPSSSECGGCAALRSSAVRVAGVASQWPTQKSGNLGSFLDGATKREDLVAELCGARPEMGARAEIERDFRYYSWTVGAEQLFKVAALFEKPEIVAGCQGR